MKLIYLISEFTNISLIFTLLLLTLLMIELLKKKMNCDEMWMLNMNVLNLIDNLCINIYKIKDTFNSDTK